MYENLDTGFIRHLGGVKENHVEYLWKNEMIGFHYNNKLSADPDDYETGETEMERLNDFAENGRIVGASYRRHVTSEMYVGVIEPGSKIHFLFFEDGSFLKKECVTPGESLSKSADNEYRIIKAVGLNETKTVSRDQHSVLFDNSVRPPGATIIPWWNVEEELREIINEESRSRKVGRLPTKQQEVLCEEFLRIANDSYRNLRSVGDNRADVDISGRTDNYKIWAEVTMGKTARVESKLETLSEYISNNGKVILFAPMNEKPDEIPDGITYLPIETVFEVVDLNQSGAKMIDNMLNIDD